MSTYNQSYSDYELKEATVKFEGENEIASSKVGCVGSLEETMDTRTVIKKCEGIVVKSVTKGTGSGSLKVSLHMMWPVYVKAFGMDFSNQLAPGVYAYGKNSKHRRFLLTGKVLDEDDNEKLVAYPQCSISSGKARKITNGSEEVAEMELDIAVFPDENGQGVYECMVAELEEGSEIATKWLTGLTPDLVKKTA